MNNRATRGVSETPVPGRHRGQVPVRPDRARLHRRVRRGLMLVTTLGVSVALATNSLAATQVTVKNPGGLTASGPVNSEYGFPSWYSDSTGVRLEPCLNDEDPLCGFLPGDIPNPDVPIVFPDNFPEEFFYHLVGGDLTLPGGGKATLTLGLEAAFAQGAAEAGEQVVFARTRVVVKGGPRSTTLTFKHPFGELTIDTDATGAGRLVQDISPAVGNFNAALAGNFGPFLKWDPTVLPLAPAGYVGDPGIAHKVVGGKNGYNAFSVTGGGINVETTDLTIQGKIATNTGVTGDYAIVNGGFLDVFATSRGSSLQVDGVTDQYPTTPLEHDEGSERQYARIPLAGGAVPTQVILRNLGDKPASTATLKVADVTVTEASYDGTDLTVSAKATSSSSYPLTVVGIGSLDSAGPTKFTMFAPPATVTVKSATGSPVTYPVTVTDGIASDPALPPVPPEPAPGPINDNTPNNPPATGGPVAVVAAIAPTVRGASVIPDASGSTGGTSYSWTQLSGPTAAITNGATAKPTITVPYYTTTTATAPAAAASPIVFTLTVTGPGGTATQSVTIPVQDDTLTVSAGARHRIGTELRIDGTSLIGGVAGARTPPTSVVIWNVTNPATPVKLGTSPVDTLGAWTLRLKPGPAAQVTSVLIQSTRGGTATATLSNR